MMDSRLRGDLVTDGWNGIRRSGARSRVGLPNTPIKADSRLRLVVRRLEAELSPVVDKDSGPVMFSIVGERQFPNRFLPTALQSLPIRR